MSECVVSEIRIANAPCSWGVLEFEQVTESIGPLQVLDEISAAGYVGTELGDFGFLPTDPHTLRAALRQRKLALVGAFVPVALAQKEAHSAGIDTALETARLLAETVAQKQSTTKAPFIVLADNNGSHPQRTQSAGRITPQMGLKDDEWQVFADGANAIARAVRRETGLLTVFHHHAAGFVETPEEVEQLLALTDPEVLGLCLDTGHWIFGGGDPLAALQTHGDRIWHLHFKDCDRFVAEAARCENLDYFQSVQRGIFCELGRGSVPFEAITAHLQQTEYDGWIVVEQDVLPGMGSPLESATRNRRFLNALGL
jgi:inosose dehydratase